MVILHNRCGYLRELRALSMLKQKFRAVFSAVEPWKFNKIIFGGKHMNTEQGTRK